MFPYVKPVIVFMDLKPEEGLACVVSGGLPDYPDKDKDDKKDKDRRGWGDNRRKRRKK